ncbi:isochorismate synthase MenF [Cryptosporangium sp. NPDC051539]|uniref:isochorismate synthase MenF n=1 Tax=Cryptosporangium sp. NPDC051539 TaxID=3363962 RepID=UPI00379F6142
MDSVRKARPPDPGLDAASLRATFAVAREASVRRGRPVLTVWTTPVPGTAPRALLRRADRLGGRVFFWSSRWTGVESVGIGSSLDVSAEGPSRFQVVRRAWHRHCQGLVTGGSAIAGQPGFPLVVGGFAFRPGRWNPIGGMPDALSWCPAVQLVRLGDGTTHLALTARVTPDTEVDSLAGRRADLARRLLATPERDADDGSPGAVVRFDVPDATGWRRAVTAAVDEIRRGELAKVVLARQVVLHAGRPFAVPAAVARLLGSTSEGAVFATRFSGRWFLGGTPECLVRVADGRVTADSLAGSMPRGATDADDAAWARALLHGAKTRHEQGLVTEFVTRALAQCCTDVTALDRPQVMRLGSVQHLVTTVTATVPAHGRAGLLDLAERLHPTPAMGGYPGPAALRWLTRSEPFDRGWYAAPVGWFDAVGEGELAVAIRSALVSGDRAALFAGCGVVAGSTPEDEYAETELKLHPMLAALDVPAAATGRAA